MAVRVVTDSVADIPAVLTDRLKVTVVPLIVRFGSESFSDGVDITNEEFYRRLKNGGDFPDTSAPAPGDFALVFDKLAAECDEILVILVSAKLSATYDAACRGRELMKKECRVEIVDSRWAAMAEGFIVLAAARAAVGADLDQIMEEVRRIRDRVDFLCTFDTLEYLRRGGRIGAAQAFLGSVLKINPLINLRNGVVMPAGRTRSRRQAIDRLYEFARQYSVIEEIAVEHTSCPEEAAALTERLQTLVPEKTIHLSNMTPVIGAHTGPGLLLVAVMGEK